jgi:hypothetical protein
MSGYCGPHGEERREATRLQPWLQMQAAILRDAAFGGSSG